MIESIKPDPEMANILLRSDADICRCPICQADLTDIGNYTIYGLALLALNLECGTNMEIPNPFKGRNALTNLGPFPFQPDPIVALLGFEPRLGDCHRCIQTWLHAIGDVISAIYTRSGDWDESGKYAREIYVLASTPDLSHENAVDQLIDMFYV
jgi:hypothetical protein